MPVEKLGTPAATLLAEMRKPVDYEQHQCRFGASIGIAVASGKGIDPKALMVGADIALYRAKENGRNRYEFFSERLQQEIIDANVSPTISSADWKTTNSCPSTSRNSTPPRCRSSASRRWRAGTIRRRAFCRPSSSSRSPRISTSSPNRPAADVPALEDMEPSGRAASIFRNLREYFLAPPCDPQLIQSLKDVSLDYGALAFEILESILPRRGERRRSAERRGIKALGIGLEIDDFGTGHASIIGLLRDPPTG